MKTTLIILTTMLITILTHGASKVGIADLYIQGDLSSLNSTKSDFDYSRCLFRNLPDTTENERYLYMLCSIVGSDSFTEWVVRNETDARIAAHMINVDYIVYGTMGKVNNYLEATLHLYQNDKEDSVYTISHVSRNNDVKTFLTEVALKLNTVLDTQIFKVEKQTIQQDTDKLLKRELLIGDIRQFRLSDYLGIYNSVGYYIPMLDWWHYTTGLALAETGIRVVNLPPLYKGDVIKLNLETGLTFTYSVGMNKPGFAESYLHMFLFKIPLAFVITIADRASFFIDAGPQAQIDHFYQSYNGLEYTNTSVAFSLNAGTGFHYWFGKRGLACLGLKAAFDVSFYDSIYLDCNIQLYNMIRFKGIK